MKLLLTGLDKFLKRAFPIIPSVVSLNLSNGWGDVITSKSVTEIFTHFNIRYSVTFTPFSCPEYRGAIWVGGRKTIAGLEINTDVWIWDRSGTPIDQDLWYRPPNINNTYYAYIDKDVHGILAHSGLEVHFYLCEIDLVC